MVKYTTPEASPEEHAKLTADGERMLQLLGLPYRKVALCTADIGFSANKCWDLEVWMPSYGTYKEISSCSNYGDYQARELISVIRKKSYRQNKICPYNQWFRTCSRQNIRCDC